MSASLHAALAYAARGFSVIPTLEKKPHFVALRETGGTSSWSRLQESPPSTDEIEAWYDVAPEAGVAIVTGTASGIVVADIEHRRLDQPAASRILNISTPVATTPAGGRHAYFATGTAVRTRRFDWGDLQADGAYVVAPPDDLRRVWEISLTEAPLAPAELLEELVTPVTLRGIPPLEVDAGSGAHAEAAALLGRLADWDARPEFVERVAGLLAIPAQLDQKFSCVLPGHQPDCRPSANLYRSPETGHVLYRCWQARATYTLAQVYAAITAGVPYGSLRWSSSIHAIWKLRLLLRTGLATVPTPTRLEVPPDFPKRFRKHLAAVEQFFDARSISRLGLAGMLVPEFLGPWIGQSAETAKELRHALRSANVIHRAGNDGRGHLYLPGPSARWAA